MSAFRVGQPGCKLKTKDADLAGEKHFVRFFGDGLKFHETVLCPSSFSGISNVNGTQSMCKPTYCLGPGKTVPVDCAGFTWCDGCCLGPSLSLKGVSGPGR